MTDLKAWFEPLLWIIATITAIGGFIRFCKPIWNLINYPKQVSQELQTLQTSVTQHFTETDIRLTSYDNTLQSISSRLDHGEAIRLSLLHDSIVQIYQKAMAAHTISDLDYKRVCDLYAEDGSSPYIDRIMQELEDLHKLNAGLPT